MSCISCNLAGARNRFTSLDAQQPLRRLPDATMQRKRYATGRRKLRLTISATRLARYALVRETWIKLIIAVYRQACMIR